MMDSQEIIKKLNFLQQRYNQDGIIFYGIFGSYARNESSQNSDIDIIYKLDKEKFFSQYKGFKSASKLAQINQEIATYFGKKIDLVSLDTTNQNLKNSMLNELILCNTIQDSK